MKLVYVRNNGRYAISFEITSSNGKTKKIALDRRRIFLDTGNVATTGITEVAEEDLEALKKFPRFNKLLESKELEVLTKSQLSTEDTDKEELVKENKKLQEEIKKLKENKKADKEDKALKEKDEEIASLKAKLEALTPKAEDTEGF